MKPPEQPIDPSFIWVDCLALTPGMIDVYVMYLRVQLETAQRDVHAAIDQGNLHKAAQAKGTLDAFAALLHHVRSRAQCG